MSLSKIRSPHVIGSPSHNVSSSDHLGERAKSRCSVTNTWVYETDDHDQKVGYPVVEVRGTGEPTMLIDADGVARFVRDRRNTAICSGRKYVYLNGHKHNLGSNPFQTSLSKIFALYEQAVSECTEQQIEEATCR